MFFGGQDGGRRVGRSSERPRLFYSFPQCRTMLCGRPTAVWA